MAHAKTSQAHAQAVGLSLAERLRAAKLPEPDVRRAIRLEAGASLRDVAKEVGVTASAVGRWERGNIRIRTDHAIAYRQVLDALREAAAA